MSLSKSHRQSLEKFFFFFFTKRIIFIVSGSNKRNNFRIFFFFYFLENFSRRVHKSTNKIILALKSMTMTSQESFEYVKNSNFLPFLFSMWIYLSIFPYFHDFSLSQCLLALAINSHVFFQIQCNFHWMWIYTRSLIFYVELSYFLSFVIMFIPSVSGKKTGAYMWIFIVCFLIVFFFFHNYVSKC